MISLRTWPTERVLLAGLLFMQIASASCARSPNARNNPVHSLRLIGQAEELYKKEDLDRKGIHNYWVGDVAGLRRIKADGRTINLLEEVYVIRDSAPLLSPRGRVTFDVKAPDIIDPYCDYWYQVIPKRADGTSYGNEFDGTESRDSYAFCAYPKVYSKEHRFTFITNESGFVWKADLSGAAVRQFPALDGRWIPATAEDEKPVYAR